jgi:hypothetical protein
MSGEREPEPEPAVTAPSGADEPPPILGTWPALYRVVLISLGTTVLALYLLARWAS